MIRNIVKTIVLVVFGFLGGVIPLATAGEWDEKTIFTFSGPVEIPGQVLPAGTYIFKLAALQSDREIVQVFSKDERHLYGTFLTITDQRLQPADKPIITFEERAAGAPEAVKAWFYPGEDFGHQFVYPKPKALELAKANNTPVPSMPAELAPNTTKAAASVNEPHIVAMSKSPLKAQMPTEEEGDIVEVFVTVQSPPVTQVAILEATPAPRAPLPTTLPSTGSPLPLIGLIGLLSAGVALTLRFAAAKSK